MEEQFEKLRRQLHDFETVVLITQDSEGGAHARPMALAAVDERCDLWFFTGGHSAKVKEIEATTTAQVICQKGWTSCVALVGRAELVRDRARMRELWKPSFQVWFPDGTEDPNLLLIRFSGDRAEYWDSTGVHQLTYLYRAVKAVLQGTTPAVTEGEQHGVVELNTSGEAPRESTPHHSNN